MPSNLFTQHGPFLSPWFEFLEVRQTALHLRSQPIKPVPIPVSNAHYHRSSHLVLLHFPRTVPITYAEAHSVSKGYLTFMRGFATMRVGRSWTGIHGVPLRSQWDTRAASNRPCISSFVAVFAVFPSCTRIRAIRGTGRVSRWGMPGADGPRYRTRSDNRCEILTAQRICRNLQGELSWPPLSDFLSLPSLFLPLSVCLLPFCG